jgi:CheY-like chemotaxis protein
VYNTRDLEVVKKVNPDLVISDYLVTREEEGWQFIQKMKMSPDTATIPIIICTTNRRVVQNMEGQLAVKNITVVFKPFDIEELLQAVEEVIGKATEPSPKSRQTGLNSKEQTPPKDNNQI